MQIERSEKHDFVPNPPTNHSDLLCRLTTTLTIVNASYADANGTYALAVTYFTNINVSVNISFSVSIAEANFKKGEVKFIFDSKAHVRAKRVCAELVASAGVVYFWCVWRHAVTGACMWHSYRACQAIKPAIGPSKLLVPFPLKLLKQTMLVQMLTCNFIIIINTKKLFEIEKDIVHEVARGDKHNLRKSADHKVQISLLIDLNQGLADLCFWMCRISQIVFITSSHLTHNFFFYFQ